MVSAIKLRCNRFHFCSRDVCFWLFCHQLNHYMYDSQNVYANRVFAPNATYSYQLSLLKEETPQPPVPDNAWNGTKIYTSGDVVMHNQQTWAAQWWTKNEEPGTTGEWGVWR